MTATKAADSLISEITAQREQTIRDIRAKYDNLRSKLFHDCQAELDEVDRQYQRAMFANLRRAA